MTVQRTFEVWIEALENGSVIDFLSEDRFPEWIELASTELLSQELCPADEGEVEDYRATFSIEQVRLLAIRLFLSSETSLLEELQPLWRAFGAAPDDCSKMVSCAKLFSESWPAMVVRVSPENRSTGIRFSRGIAVRTETSRTLANVPFFEFIRQSRALNAKLHTGFPVLLGCPNSNLNSAVWITPIPDPKNNFQIHAALQDHWKRLLSTVHQLIRGAPLPDDCTWTLPSYLHHWANLENGGVQTLESAGLALAMQMHAELTEQTLPLGVGFSGRWDSNSQLRGVCGIGEKMKAAQRAGVSLLFICLDPTEKEPFPLTGLTVVVLPEYLCLSEVIRLVNQCCAESGVTEYGSPSASELIYIHCPRGFVGRGSALSILGEKAEMQEKGLFGTIASPGSGKSTLLRKFWSDSIQRPCWFNFRLNDPLRQTCAQMQDDLISQISRRHIVLESPDALALVSVDSFHEKLVKSTNAHVTIIVDGLDEAENAIESKKALAWLQRFSSTATVFFGAQQLAFLNDCEFTRLELPGVTTSSFEDANSLIASYADSFGNDCRRSDIVAALIDGRASELADKAGGNLWIITDFLESLIRANNEPWPQDLDATILTNDVSKYCRKLMAQALSGYDDDVPSRKAIQDFLQCLSFLGEGAWEINDVLRFAGIDRIGDNRELWRFSGDTTIARLIEVEGNKCRLWNRLTHEAVLGHFSREEAWLLNRANEFLRENSGGAVYDCVVGKFAGFIGRCAANSACELLDGSPWLARRLELCLEHSGSIKVAIDELSALHGKQDLHGTFGLLKLLDWLNGWRAAIERDDVPVQEWLSRAGDSTARFVKLTSPSRLGTKLLVPYMSAYQNSWPTSPEFAECVCEAKFGKDWLLVFGDQRGGILVYRQVPAGYERFGSIRVRDGARVLSLAMSNDSFVFALLVDKHQRYEIWKVNVTTGAMSPFAKVNSDGRVFTTRTHEYLVFAPKQLGRQSDGGNERLLKVFNSAGQELYEIPTGLLRSQNDCSAIVSPYIKNEIAVLAPVDHEFGLARFDLQATGYTELKTPNSTRVNGAMADEAGRLIWVDRDASGDTSFLNWTGGELGTSGRTLIFSRPKFENDEDEHAYHAMLRETNQSDNFYLLHATPRGWLYAGHTATQYVTLGGVNSLFSMRLEPESIRRELSREALESAFCGSSTEVKGTELGLHDGHALFVFKKGAVIVDARNGKAIRIERGKRMPFEIAKLCTRADGQCISFICGPNENSSNVTQRIEFENGPVLAPTEDHILSELAGHHVSANGWEVHWDGTKLYSRNSDVPLALAWNATEHFNGCYPTDDCEDTLDHSRALPVSNQDLADIVTTQVELSAEEVEILSIADCDCDSLWILVRAGRHGQLCQFHLLQNRVLKTVSVEVEAIVRCITSGPRPVKLRSGTLRLEILNGASSVVLMGLFAVGQDSPFAVFLFDGAKERLVHLDKGYRRVVDLSDGCVMLIGKCINLLAPNVAYYKSGAVACADLELRVSARAEGEWLTALEDIFVVEPVGHGARMHTLILLESCFIRREVWEYYIESGTLELDSSEPIYRYDPDSHTRTQLGNGLTCWDKSDDIVVLGYQSGRIECRLIGNLPEVWRVGYHTSAPTSVKIVDYGDRRFVAVAAGDVWWFEIPKVATRF